MRGFTFGAALLLSACSDTSGADYFSGHQVGIQRAGQVMGVGDVRVEVARVRASAKNPIPQTRYFSFSHSPEGHRKIVAQNKWRSPVDADWDRYRDLILATRDWSLYADPRKAQREWVRLVDRQKAEEKQAEYKSRVRPDGMIVLDMCGGTVSGRRHCAKGLPLPQTQKARLAQQALDRFDPGCRLGQIDPPAVVALTPNHKSGPLSLIAAIDCG